MWRLTAHLQFLLLLAAACCQLRGAAACTSYIVGSAASTDGSVLIARNDDGDGAVSPNWLVYHPARKGPAVLRANLNNLTITLPGPGLAYWALPAGPLADAGSGTNTTGDLPLPSRHARAHQDFWCSLCCCPCLSCSVQPQHARPPEATVPSGWTVAVQFWAFGSRLALLSCTPARRLRCRGGGGLERGGRGGERYRVDLQLGGSAGGRPPERGQRRHRGRHPLHPAAPGRRCAGRAEGGCGGGPDQRGQGCHSAQAAMPLGSAPGSVDALTWAA